MLVAYSYTLLIAETIADVGRSLLGEAVLG